MEQPDRPPMIVEEGVVVANRVSGINQPEENDLAQQLQTGVRAGRAPGTASRGSNRGFRLPASDGGPGGGR